jgi:hypothetical protein
MPRMEKTPLDRLVSAFAILFTPALPLLAGVCVVHSHPILVNAIGDAALTRARTAMLPPFPRFVFVHTAEIFWAMFFVSLALSLLSWWQLRCPDPVTRLGRLLILACGGASVAVVFLGMFLLAVAYALNPI